MEWLTNAWNSIVENYWKPSQFIPSLKYMWQGMLCIFVVIGVIILSVYLMGYISSKAEEKKQAKNDAENE